MTIEELAHFHVYGLQNIGPIFIDYYLLVIHIVKSWRVFRRVHMDT